MTCLDGYAVTRNEAPTLLRICVDCGLLATFADRTLGSNLILGVIVGLGCSVQLALEDVIVGGHRGSGGQWIRKEGRDASDGKLDGSGLCTGANEFN